MQMIHSNDVNLTVLTSLGCMISLGCVISLGASSDLDRSIMLTFLSPKMSSSSSLSSNFCTALGCDVLLGPLAVAVGRDDAGGACAARCRFAEDAEDSAAIAAWLRFRLTPGISNGSDSVDCVPDPSSSSSSSSNSPRFRSTDSISLSARQAANKQRVVKSGSGWRLTVGR